ncbi:hypothetical protein EMQ25_07155 [Arsenicitalea aurantiaca]|uniref:PepSY domain-containing protein n=1 Tax=Arsenicitalea aurantiaca TaxID=1783274 RepID=A0A433XFW4_9HYPH|nr:hypothetical protein [Arsenicitalea aurantiaca]RUT32904.1 hypothetical protein EMQ25_07155 [Arsenicitalea aurantiaca]
MRTTRDFRRILRSALVGLSLAAASVTAMPAQAQPGFDMHFGFGTGFVDRDRDRRPRFFQPPCLTDYQIRQRIAARGYSNIYLNVARRPYIQVRATEGRWVYLIEFDFCRDEIVGRERLRPA